MGLIVVLASLFIFLFLFLWFGLGGVALLFSR